MKWREIFFKKTTNPKVDLPKDWLEVPVPSVPRPKKPAQQKQVINLAQPAPAPKTNRSRGKITTPVPAKKGSKTLNLAGKQDVFNRRSPSVIDMRKKPKS